MDYKSTLMRHIENGSLDSDLQYREVPLLHNTSSAFGCIGDRPPERAIIRASHHQPGMGVHPESVSSRTGSSELSSRDLSPFLLVPCQTLPRFTDWERVSRSSSVPSLFTSADSSGKALKKSSDQFEARGGSNQPMLLFCQPYSSASYLTPRLSAGSEATKSTHHRDVFLTKSLPEFHLRTSTHSATNASVFPAAESLPGCGEMMVKSWSPSSTPVFDLAVKIQRMSMEFLLSFGETGSQPGQLNEPNGIAIDEWENIFVADTNNIRIQGFHQAGQLCSIFSQNDGLQYPFGIAVSPHAVIVIERSPGYSVKLYGPDGKFQRNLNSGRMKNLRCVTIDPRGRVVVVQGKDEKKVTVFHEGLTGAVSQRFPCEGVDFPRSVAASRHEELFIADNTKHRICVYSYAGELRRCIGREGLTDFPVGIYVNDAGHLVVIDNHMTFKITVLTECGQYVYGYKYERSLQKVLDVAVNSRGLVAVACEDKKSFKIHMMRFVDPTTVQKTI